MSSQPRVSAPALPPLLKHLNERTVLEAIRSGAPISRAEISRRAGISKPTVSLALQSLLDAGLVREATSEPDGPRYGAVFFEPVPEAALVLGLDVGGRFLRGAICDLRGDVRARLDVEIDGSDAGRVLDQIADLRTRLVTATGLDGALVNGAVVGVPGVVDAERRRIALATSVAGLEGDTFGGDLEQRLGLSVSLENDVNLAALGEHWQGVARGVDDFLFLSIGTGMGAGLVLRGELHRGHNGAAGEVDFALVGLAQDVDPCAGAVSAFAARLVADARPPDGARAAVRRARDLRRGARRATRSPARSSTRSRAGSRSTSSPSPPSPTSRSSSSAAGSARTATSSSSPCARGSRGGSRTRRASRCPRSARRRS